VALEPGDTGLAEAVQGKQQVQGKVRVRALVQVELLELERAEEAEQRGQKTRHHHRHHQPTTESSVAEPEQSHTDSWVAARAQWHYHKAMQLAFALEEDIPRKPAVLLANTAATGATPHTEVELGAEAGADPEAVRKAPSLELASLAGLPWAPDNTGQEEQGLVAERLLLALRRDCCSMCVVTRQMPNRYGAAAL
jgi:hypothetical protein